MNNEEKNISVETEMPEENNDSPITTSTKKLSGGVIGAIIGGALMPPLQGMIIDAGTVAGMPAVKFSYLLPMLCFVVVTIYGFGCRRMQRQK